MNITIGNLIYKLKDLTPSFSGREADIYLLNEGCLKYFTDEILSKKIKKEKVLLLCDKYQDLQGKEGFRNIGLPKYPAYSKDSFIGFKMEFFKNSKTITEYRYYILQKEYKNIGFNDKAAHIIVKQLFKSLQLVHTHKIILGDINPENILINNSSFESFIIDVDSAHVGNYPCFLTMPEYICPSVEAIGKNSDDSYSFSTSSDIYSLSIISFELFIGVHPFTPPVEPIIDMTQAKREGISFLSFHHKKSTKYKEYFLENKMLYTLVFERLDHVEKNYPDLYQYFLDVLFYKKRTYYGHQISKRPINKKRVQQKSHGILPIRGYTPSKEKADPSEFGLFLKQYNINLNSILQ
ncbi:protein kinase domain-containing protein [Polaribacter sp.]|uniref:protein kinase domain-containing protein n=1 Tax=Polaribacter sp. TaxID=1920175 RepID=UPI003F6B644D